VRWDDSAHRQQAFLRDPTSDWPHPTCSNDIRVWPLDPAITRNKSYVRMYVHTYNPKAINSLLLEKASSRRKCDENGSRLLYDLLVLRISTTAYLLCLHTRNYFERCEWRPMDDVLCTRNVIQNATAAPRRSQLRTGETCRPQGFTVVASVQVSCIYA
jgi:hypothetical protein